MSELKLLPIDLSGLSASLLGVLPKRKFGSEGDDTVTDPDTGFQVFTAEVLLFSGADADEHFSDVIRVSVPIGPGKGPDQLLELLTAAPNTPVEVYGLTAGCLHRRDRIKPGSISKPQVWRLSSWNLLHGRRLRHLTAARLSDAAG